MEGRGGNKGGKGNAIKEAADNMQNAIKDQMALITTLVNVQINTQNNACTKAPINSSADMEIKRMELIEIYERKIKEVSSDFNTSALAKEQKLAALNKALDKVYDEVGR